MRLPEDFTKEMKALIGAEYEDYIASYEEPRNYGLRVNTQKISVEEFLKITPFELTPIPWIENGFYYDGEKDQPAKHPYYYAGLYYIQEPSAMTPASRLPIEPGEWVLDLCAAPGGKTTELGAKLQGEGLLVSNDISNSRARILLKNLERFGIGNICVISEDPEKMVPIYEEAFDKILIDAPCSGEGMFRKDTKMIQSYESQGPEYYCEIQKTLILQGAAMLKPSGMMLYSTCTFNKRENEDVIAYLLEQDSSFELQEIAPYEGFTKGFAPLEQAVRIWPHKMRGEGHFLALLKKNGEPKETKIKKSKGVEIPLELKEFWENVNTTLDRKRLFILGEKVYYLPEHMEKIKKLRVLRDGILLGELKKKRFEPSQALAMVLEREDYKQVVDFTENDARVIKYLKGETIDVEDVLSNRDKGWFLVCVDGYPLGFAKAANGSLKNKYAVGWRWQS